MKRICVVLAVLLFMTMAMIAVMNKAWTETEMQANTVMDVQEQVQLKPPLIVDNLVPFTPTHTALWQEKPQHAEIAGRNDVIKTPMQVG